MGQKEAFNLLLNFSTLSGSYQATTWQEHRAAEHRPVVRIVRPGIMQVTAHRATLPPPMCGPAKPSKHG